MHILIISGTGDIRGYIQDSGICLNFIRSMHLDSVPSNILPQELHMIAITASETSKGVCFVSNRKEVIDAIKAHFSDNHNNYVEQIFVNK